MLCIVRARLGEKAVAFSSMEKLIIEGMAFRLPDVTIDMNMEMGLSGTHGNTDREGYF